MTNTMPMATAGDEWTIDALDLDKYLQRIGCVEPPTPDANTLVRLHRAHVAAIPFENLDVIARIGVSVELRCVQAKLVGAGRGGYCYEHGLLFAAALQRLGYRVRRMLARVGADLSRPRARTHMVLVVTIDGEDWLADVGFGSGLLEPIRLQAAHTVKQGAWAYRLARPAEGCWQLLELEAGRWVGRYAFGLQREHLSDIAVANHYSSTSPRSPFVSQPVVVRKDDHAVRRLRGRQLSLVRASGVVCERRIADAELEHVLHELGLEVPARVLDAVRGWSAG